MYSHYERREARLKLAFTIAISLVAILFAALASAATLDLELESPLWAKQTVVELGTCKGAPRGKVKFGTAFITRAVPASTTFYSIGGVPEVPTCIRLSWHADGVEVVSPEIFVAMPDVTTPASLQLLAAQTIIRIDAVPTGAGVISTKWRDGDDGSVEIPLTWASIPNFVDKPDGTAFSVGLRQYLTEAGNPAATLSLVGSVANWSLSGDNLQYDGSGVSSGTLIARATRLTFVSDSLPFTVSSIAVTTSGCLSGFTCQAVDSGTCVFTLEDSSTTMVISATGAGACTATKSFSSETDRRFTVQILGTSTFGDNNAGGGGSFIARGTNWLTDYRSIAWYPKTGAVNFRTDAAGSSVNQTCTADALPEYIDQRYEQSVDGQSAFRSNDGSSFTQCGASVDGGAISSGVYGMWAKAQGGTTTVMRFKVINDSTTIPATPDPPAPPGDPICINRQGGPPWCSGVGLLQGGVSSIPALTTWQNGAEPDVYVTWCGQTCQDNTGGWPAWSDTVKGGDFPAALAGLPQDTMLILTYFLFPQDIDPNLAGNQNADNCGSYAATAWDRLASGEFDSRIAAFALALRNQYQAKRPNDPTGKYLALRWGHELNGSHYWFSICGNVPEFKAYWNRSVPLLRHATNGLPDMKMDLSPVASYLRCSQGQTCNPRIELADWVPDADKVDVLTRSVHNEFAGEVSSLADFTLRHVNNYLPGNLMGLEPMCDLAISKGWKCGSSEWGSHLTNGTSCTPPDWPSEASQVAFTQGFYNWLASRDPNDIAWDSNLATSCQGYYARRANTAAATLYQSLWFQ